MSFLFGFFVLGLIIAIYFAPIIVAVDRCHPNLVPITIINIFLGWTLIGWVVALCWSSMHFDKKLQNNFNERHLNYVESLKEPNESWNVNKML
jgi:predicted PurR-regulated permease PerM